MLKNLYLYGIMYIKYEFLSGESEEIFIESGSELAKFYLESAHIKSSDTDKLIISEEMYSKHEGRSYYRPHKFYDQLVELEDLEIIDQNDYYAELETKLL